MTTSKDIMQRRRQLQKARDSDRDPARIEASVSTSTSVTEPAGAAASNAEGETASRKATVKSRADLGLTPRRRGRPRGPERVQLSVRVRLEVDEALSELCATRGLGPQEIVEEAILALAAKEARRAR